LNVSKKISGLNIKENNHLFGSFDGHIKGFVKAKASKRIGKKAICRLCLYGIVQKNAV